MIAMNVKEQKDDLCPADRVVEASLQSYRMLINKKKNSEGSLEKNKARIMEVEKKKKPALFQ